VHVEQPAGARELAQRVVAHGAHAEFVGAVAVEVLDPCDSRETVGRVELALEGALELADLLRARGGAVVPATPAARAVAGR
jgi:hypothetical protein